jgi:hypothetical protein
MSFPGQSQEAFAARLAANRQVLLADPMAVRVLELKASDFAGREGSIFAIVLPGGYEVQLELTKVQERQAVVETARAPLMLIFRSRANLPQDNYLFATAPLDGLCLTMVPICPGDDGLMYYQLTFN